MSHKDKICQKALVGHVETCHNQYSYTPLIVKKDLYTPIPLTSGVNQIIENQIQEQLAPTLKEVQKEQQQFKELLESEVDRAFDEACESKHERKSRISSSSLHDLKRQTQQLIEQKLVNDFSLVEQSLKKEIIDASDGTLEINNPEQVIDKLEDPIRKQIDVIVANDMDPISFPRYNTYELEGLGMFFQEVICQRSEGLMLNPCGKEITILPGETIHEKNVLTTTISEENSTERTTSEDLTTTNRIGESESFNDSYERKLHKETDLDITAEGSFTFTPFKWLGLDLSAKGTYDMKSILDEVNKTSHSFTKKRFDEVVRNYKSSGRFSSNNSLTTNEVLAFDRSWKNETDKHMTFIKRKSYCKTSVIHKRTNVQLAWNGCIENPARDLCTPDTIEIKHAEEIQAIRDKWNAMPVPGNFGSRPRGRQVCTTEHEDYNHSLHTGVSKFRQPFHYTIPSGWFYEQNSASVNVVSHSSGVEEKLIYSQPNGGARGGVSFDASVILDNRWLKKEKVTFRVCFNILPDAAMEWDEQVAAWRNQKAQEEIDAFIEAKTKELKKFLASDQARASIERRIMEDFFGVTPINDCCKLISRLKRLFDFENMTFTLLPSWNELGQGCQKAFPVNLYTAKCLHFYIPIREGKEREAVTLLAAINAIPWNPNLASQIFAYINQIHLLRDTLYKRTFDPTGWDVKFDQPKGYEMTPYDTTNSDWSAAHESNRNFEVLGAFTVNVPCGERIDPRPMLCE
jgi:hypothetical protein